MLPNHDTEYIHGYLEVTKSDITILLMGDIYRDDYQYFHKIAHTMRFMIDNHQ